MTRVYMIRHAKSPYYNGQEKSRPLSDEGMKDALSLVEFFKSKKIDSCYSSDYKRAEMTIKALADDRKLNIVSLESLRERLLKPSHVDLAYDDFMKTLSKSYQDIDYKIYDCESIRDVQKRGIKALEGILEAHRDDNIIIGTHGNFMTAIFNYYDQSFDYEFWKSLKMPDVFEMVFDGLLLKSIKRLEA